MRSTPVAAPTERVAGPPGEAPPTGAHPPDFAAVLDDIQARTALAEGRQDQPAPGDAAASPAVADDGASPLEPATVVDAPPPPAGDVSASVLAVVPALPDPVVPPAGDAVPQAAVADVAPEAPAAQDMAAPSPAPAPVDVPAPAVPDTGSVSDQRRDAPPAGHASVTAAVVPDVAAATGAVSPLPSSFSPAAPIDATSVVSVPAGAPASVDPAPPSPAPAGATTSPAVTAAPSPVADAPRAAEPVAGTSASPSDVVASPVPETEPSAAAAAPPVLPVDAPATQARETGMPGSPAGFAATSEIPAPAPSPTPAPVQSAAPAPPAAPAPAPTAAAAPHVRLDLAATVERVHDLVRIAASNGVTRAQLELHPVELGTVGVTLRATSDGVVASITAQDQIALDALQGAAVDLRRELEDRGVALVGLDLHLAGGDDRPASDRTRHDGAIERADRGGDPAPETDGDDARVAGTPVHLPAGVLVDVKA